MKNKTTHFLAVSLAAVLVLCVAVFSFLAYYMNKKTMDTISEVGTVYMTGMNERISIHFQTTIELRLSQVEALLRDYPHQGDTRGDMRDKLSYSAEALITWLSVRTEDSSRCFLEIWYMSSMQSLF